MDYFETSLTIVNLFYIFGYVCIIPLIPVMGFIITSTSMLRYSLIISVLLSSVGGGIRSFAAFFPTSPMAIFFLCFGQILNAIAGVITYVCPPTVSMIWFKQNERTFATSIMISSAYFGTGLIYLIGPYLVEWVGFDWYLHIQTAHGIIVLCFFLYCPEKPLIPPSPASLNITHLTIPEYLSDTRTAFKNLSFILLVFVGGAIMGIVGGIMN
jgi:hypothetical protein